MSTLFPKQKTIWIPINEVIDTYFCEETNICPEALLGLFKKTPNQPQFLPS